MTAPTIPTGYQAVIDARAEVVAALDGLQRAQDRLEEAVAQEARAMNAFAGLDLPEPRPLGVAS